MCGALGCVQRDQDGPQLLRRRALPDYSRGHCFTTAPHQCAWYVAFRGGFFDCRFGLVVWVSLTRVAVCRVAIRYDR